MTQKQAQFPIEFDSFAVDLERETVIRDGTAVSLRPKSYQVLKYLLEHQGRLVTREELFNAVWPERVFTKSLF